MVFKKLIGLVFSACCVSGLANAAEPQVNWQGFAGPTLKGVLATGVLRIGTDATFPPMEYIEADNPEQIIGFDVDIGNELARRIGVRAEFVNSAWSGIFPALLGKKFDMVISGLTLKSERIKTLTMVPFYATGPVFMVRAGNPHNIHTLDDLNGVRAGAQIGTQGAAMLKEADERLQGEGKEGLVSLQTFETLTDVIDQMRIGRIDVDIVDAPTVAYFQKKHPGKIEMVPGLLQANLNGLAVRPDSPDLAAAATWALLQMYEDGTYEKIWNKWIGE